MHTILDVLFLHRQQRRQAYRLVHTIRRTNTLLLLLRLRVILQFQIKINFSLISYCAHLYLGTYSVANPAGTAYPPYKTAAPPNGAPSNSYPSYPPGAAPAHAPYGVPPTSHLSGGSAVPSSAPPHLYGTQPAGGSIVSRRPDYYPSASVAQPMQYVQHQSSAMPYR